MNVGAGSPPVAAEVEVDGRSVLLPPTLLCLSFHHKCTEGVASHKFRGGPSTEIRRIIEVIFTKAVAALCLNEFENREGTFHMSIRHWNAKMKLG